ncbi:TetR/AcrR family transcriptional regulator [Holdemania filiformis]|uniref:TetR/AcrR family transcriptional regulator n=1 Tax=Holdemania filiformis TaxID=61171 RepID=UPI00210D59B8|nr:TetR/AcrR family transcriptional regulator [Holdemania filiformis]MCQ4951163.1 TetR/AcrR family transcriptional regulator [Holdemania filiformis]
MPRSARFTTTHDLLKKQALALFLEKGYEQTSIQEITERAGLAVGSFYRHFPCKEEIFVEIWDEYAAKNIRETLKKAEAAGDLKSFLDILMQENELFADDPVTAALYSTHASLISSHRVDNFPAIAEWSMRYRRQLQEYIQRHDPDLSESEARTRANVVHCLLNSYAMRYADRLQRFTYDAKPFRAILYSLLKLEDYDTKDPLSSAV